MSSSGKGKRRKPGPAKPVPAAAGPASGDPLDRHGFWWALAILAILLAIFFNPLLFGGKTFQAADTLANQAYRVLDEEALNAPGNFLDNYPLWTPYVFSGMPAFASLATGPYSNPSTLVLSPVPGVLRGPVFYLLIGLFTWLLLRQMGVGTLAGLVGAAGYVFCTHVITFVMFGHSTKIVTLVYLPLFLLSLIKIWRKPSLLWILILGLVCGNMLLARHVQIAYYVFLAGGIFLIVSTVIDKRQAMSWMDIARRWMAGAAGLVLGALASAFLTLPIREYAAYSIRGGTEGGLSYDYATSWSLHPLEMSTFFIPSFMGFRGNTYWGWMPFTDFPHYMGILVLCLAVLTLVLWPRERMHIFLWVLAAFALVVSFGRNLPVLYNLMFEYLPYFNKFRVPVMILVLFQFSVAALAALGLHRMLTANGAERTRILGKLKLVGGAFLAVIVLLGGLAAAGMLDGGILGRIQTRASGMGVPAAQLAPYSAQVLSQVKDMVAKDTAVVLLVLALGLGAVWAFLRGKMPAAAAAAAVLVLTMADLWNVDHRPATYHPRTEGPSLEETPAVSFLKNDPEPFRILPLNAKSSQNWYACFDISSILGYHPAKLEIYQDLIDDGGPVGISKTLSQGNFNIIDMLNVKYVVADREIAVGPLETVLRGPETIMRNNASLPRMWFVDRIRAIPDEDAHLQAMADPAWNPGEEALLFEDPGALDPGSGGTATLTEYRPREIRATVDSPGNSLLVLSEIYYPPGWRAWIDGRPAKILRADYVLRALVVPPGSHEIRMRYDPPTFRAGVMISGTTYTVLLVGLGVSLLFARRKRRSGGDAVPQGDE